MFLSSSLRYGLLSWVDIQPLKIRTASLENRLPILAGGFEEPSLGTWGRESSPPGLGALQENEDGDGDTP
jgi:hypothetical protein